MIQLSRKQKTELVAIFGYLNNHATAVLEEIADDVSVQFFYWRDFPKFRADNNWTIPAGAKKLSLLRPIAFAKNCWQIFRSPAVYFHGITVPALLSILMLGIVARLGACRKVFVASEGLKNTPSKIKQRLLRFFLNHKNIIHLGIGYRSSQDYFECGLTKWSFRKFAFCEKYDPVTLTQDTRQGPFKILSVGQLIVRKNHSRLIQAVAKLDAPASVSVDIAGNGPREEALIAEAKSLGIESQFNFAGFCDHDQLNAFFRNADIFVLQSNYDGWGVVVGHAAHFGLPILISPSVRAGQDFLVQHGHNGFITETADDLANAISQLVNDSALRALMGQRSLELSEIWGIANVSKRLGLLLKDPDSTFETGPFSPAKINVFLKQKHHE